MKAIKTGLLCFNRLGVHKDIVQFVLLPYLFHERDLLELALVACEKGSVKSLEYFIHIDVVKSMHSKLNCLDRAMWKDQSNVVNFLISRMKVSVPDEFLKEAIYMGSYSTVSLLTKNLDFKMRLFYRTRALSSYIFLKLDQMQTRKSIEKWVNIYTLCFSFINILFLLFTSID